MFKKSRLVILAFASMGGCGDGSISHHSDSGLSHAAQAVPCTTDGSTVVIDGACRCAFGFEPGQDACVPSACGSPNLNSYLQDETCFCHDGYDWCDPNHPDLVACCPIEALTQCGDGICDPQTEDANSCRADCPARCGDGLCTQPDEDSSTCPADCDSICGDNVCDRRESFRTCSLDCDSRCGDGFCNPINESNKTCAQDCPAVCGDGYCHSSEKRSTGTRCWKDCPPSRVSVKISQVHVGPTKSDGCQWDGLTCSPLSGSALAKYASMVGASTPIAAAVGMLAEPIFNAVSKPDPFGQATYGNQTISAPATQDQFTAPFNNRESFTVQFTSSARIALTIKDEDLMYHDLIFSGDITFNDIKAALESGGNFLLDTRRRSNNQLIAITLNVTALD